MLRRTVTLILGCSARYRSIWRSRYRVVDSLAPTVSRPAELSRNSASEFSSSRSRLSKRRANSSALRPASVSSSSLPERSISFSPSSCSSLCSASDTAGCVRSIFSAAREKLPSLATIRNTCSGFSSMAFDYNIG